MSERNRSMGAVAVRLVMPATIPATNICCLRTPHVYPTTSWCHAFDSQTHSRRENAHRVWVRLTFYEKGSRASVSWAAVVARGRGGARRVVESGTERVTP